MEKNNYKAAVNKVGSFALMCGKKAGHKVKETIWPNRVIWPSFRKSVVNTCAVLAVSAFSAALIAAMDTAFSFVLRAPFVL